MQDLCKTPPFGQFWSLRGVKRRSNLVDYQHVVRLFRFARNDNTDVMQSSLCELNKRIILFFHQTYSKEEHLLFQSVDL